MRLIDLHTHSTASDGSFSPREVVKLSKKKGLSAIALTDHDTVAGNKEAITTGEKLGIEVISGIEVSAYFEKGTLHILGYFVDYEDKNFLKRLSVLQEARAERNPKIIKKLQGLGIHIDYEEVVAASGGGQIGRPHIAQVLIKKGIVNSLEEAFEKYLKKGRPAYVEKERITPEQCLEMLIEANALPVLAHPYTLNLDEQGLRRFVKRLKDCGLMGIEVYYPDHSPPQIKNYLDLARDFDLAITGGSDFHGKNKKGVELGTGYGDLRIPYSLLEKLKKIHYRGKPWRVEIQ